MIGYLDTSAFVPLLVAEPTTPSCQQFWNATDAAVSSRIIYVEAAAALAQALRLGRLTKSAHARALKHLDEMWEQIEVSEVDATVVTRAAVLAHRLGLRGYDAIHCASAERLRDPALVGASGDRRLLEAWARVGLAAYDTSQPLPP